MAPALNRWRSRPALFAAGGLVAALALFSSGVLVARATIHSDDAPAVRTTNATEATASPKPAVGVNLAADKGGAPIAPDGRSVAPSAGIGIGYGGDGGLAIGNCGTDISGALSGASVDPSKLGFQSNLLKDGFTLTGISFRSEGQCGPDAKSSESHLVLMTQWSFGDTGVQLSVTQRQQTGVVTNALMNGAATFFADGYAYNLWANNFGGYAVPPYLPADGGAKPAMPMPYPGGVGQDPDIAKALDAAIAQLAPNIGAQCFYRQVQGTWADLAALGIGDPRPAIPADLKEGNFQLNKFEQPAAGCAAGVAPDPHQFGPTLNATFVGTNTFLNIGANAIVAGDGRGPGYPGSVGPGGANWSNGRYFFYISGQGKSLQGNSVTSDVIRQIAAALDPQFANACFVTTSPITPEDVATLGIHVPAAPDGYRLDNSNAAASERSAGCGVTPGKGYNLSWMFFPSEGIGTKGLIQADISLGATDPNRGVPYFGEGSLVWSDANGVRYSVSGFKGEVPRETLISVAKSMDPAFSESRLEANPAGSSSSGPGSTGVAGSPPAPMK